jgi:glycosyltransferase involved in cell wall biosynthesis
MISSAPRRQYGVVNTAESPTSASARFATALADSLSCRHDTIQIVATRSAPADAHPSGALGPPRPLAAVADELNRCDVAIVHHSVDHDDPTRGDSTELGLRVLEVIERVHVPTILVLHHVAADPTADQLRRLAHACRSADAVAVTTAPAALRLASTYGVDPSALWLLRSGPTTRHGASMTARRPTVVTWGIVAPGSGIEWMIDAMVQLSALDVGYLIAGPTSSELPADEAEDYRNALIQRCWSRGVAAHVTFQSADADQAAMTEALRNAVAVIVPQDVAGDPLEGFLEEILAAGVPIVATDAAAASQALPAGAALLVPREDPAALTDAVLRVMIDARLGESMTRSAAQSSPPATWSGVARQLDRLADAAIRSSSATWRPAV